VVYSAAWEGNPVEVFSARIGSPESRPLAMPGARLLAVSSEGELAVALGWRYISNWEARGTLARVPLSGGAPRQVLEDVQDADWSPNGKELAVVRQVGDTRVLEYPIGRQIFQTSGWLTRPRISRDGKTVAFVEHPLRGDNIGRIVIAESSGRSRAITAVGPLGDVAWSADGADLWSTESQALFRITPAGRRTVTLRIPVNGVVEDVAPDGRLLLSLIPYRREVVALPPAGSRERNLTWLNWSYPSGFSRDGNQLLFEEQALGGEYAVYIRKTDGSDAIRLGSGRALALSPDGQWTLMLAPDKPNQLILTPTGPGEARKLVPASITYAPNGNFFPDGRRFLVQGSEPGRGTRLFVQGLEGKPRPISAEGVSFARYNAVSPDGKRIAAIGPDRRIALYPAEPGEPEPIPGLEPDEFPIGWTPDGRSLYVAPSSGVPARIHIVDVATGRRTLWKVIDAPDPAGVLRIGPYFLSADGQSYIYSYRREVGDLFLVEGLQ
jgi:Tol biopolymer transport system component